jgi:hypothetical protein
MMKNNDWVVTDPSCNQKMKKISETCFLFQEDRTVNPITRETKPFVATINLNDYSRKEIIEHCNAFGYPANQVNDWLENQKELGLIAECIFEMLN